MQERNVMAQVVRYLFRSRYRGRLVRRWRRRILPVPHLILILLELFANVILVIIKTFARVGDYLVVFGLGVLLQAKPAGRSVRFGSILFERVERRISLHRIERPRRGHAKRSHLVYTRRHTDQSGK